MPPSSRPERRGEVYRNRPVRRLRRSDFDPDGRSLVCHDLAALGCRPVWIAAFCLAPVVFCVCRLHHRALVDGVGGGKMADTGLSPRQEPAANPPLGDRFVATEALPPRRSGLRRVFAVIATVAVAALAVGLGRSMWQVYMAAPWTRDATVRVYVVTMAPQVAGQIVQLPVREGDLLLVSDPTDYRIAVELAEAAVQQAQANAENAAREAQRRRELTQLSVSKEQKQTYESEAMADQAAYQQALARLAQARVNLKRTEIRSPVNGYVTNLLAQLGDYANVGDNLISLIDADSFWVDAYFEETYFNRIGPGDRATVKLMGYPQLLRGHVDSFARGINVANAQPNREGLAQVNPIFTWVRLAQRIPVRIHIDAVPRGVNLVAGMTATVHIEPGTGSRKAGAAASSPASQDQ